MRKNKFLTAVCMLSAFVGSNLHAKTSKTKKVDKSKTSHKPVKNRKSHSGSNTGIYGISSRDKESGCRKKAFNFIQQMERDKVCFGRRF